MQNKGIGVSNLPNLLHNEFRKRPCDLNVMIIGSHGLGKTTFLNKLIGNEVLAAQPFEERESSPFWYLEAKCNIQGSRVEIIENDLVTRLTVYEVDCLGDSVDNAGCYTPVVKLLEAKFNDYAAKFCESTTRGIRDERIHLCFFFLEPVFSVSTASIETLRRIAPLCTVIPVIAKADLLSSDQVQQIRCVIRQLFEENAISIFEENGFADQWPFLIFSESREDGKDGRMWRDTAFQTTAVNDFQVVKRIILERDAYQLIKDTDQFYDNYRITQMLQQTNDKEIKEARDRIERKIAEYQQEVKELQSKIREEACE